MLSHATKNDGMRLLRQPPRQEGEELRKKRIGIMLCILFFACAGTALCEEIVIPSGTAEIQEEAFYGCASVNRITVPDSVTTIGEEAFTGCGEALLIVAEPGSAAAEYAVSHRIDCNAGTQYRALLICQTYPGTYNELEGPAADRQAMQGCLEASGFSVRSESNLSAEEMTDAIRTTFSAADRYDVSLLYYSGHGDTGGNLLGADEAFTLLSPNDLRAALDSVPGRKVIIVDACYSGKLIEEDAPRLRSAQSGAGQFVNAFQSAFRPRLRGALNAEEYFVITAAQGNEASLEAGIEGKAMGLFTYGFCLGCGWDSTADSQSSLAADANGDRAVSIHEAFEFARVIPGRFHADQTAAVWPADCRWFAPFRR